jgi:hypothetical protein
VAQPTNKEIELGLARTGKLVISGTLILMFDDPRRNRIRALLVPAFIRLLGNANWWMPAWTHTALRIRQTTPAVTVASENV